MSLTPHPDGKPMQPYTIKISGSIYAIRIEPIAGDLISSQRTNSKGNKVVVLKDNLGERAIKVLCKITWGDETDMQTVSGFAMTTDEWREGTDNLSNREIYVVGGRWFLCPP